MSKLKELLDRLQFVMVNEMALPITIQARLMSEIETYFIQQAVLEPGICFQCPHNDTDHLRATIENVVPLSPDNKALDDLIPFITATKQIHHECTVINENMIQCPCLYTIIIMEKEDE